MRNTSFSEIHNCLEPLLKEGVEKGVFSGGAVGVFKKSKREEKNHFFCYGKTRKDGKANLIKETTFFDLASLTKPFCTVLSILHLIETKKLSLANPINTFFNTKTAHFLKNINIEHLLSHSSGLKAYTPFYMDFQPVQEKENKKRMLKSIFSEKLIYTPGEKCVYSDLGFIILGEILERVTGNTLDVYFSTKIARPLGLEKKLVFRPFDEYGKKSKEDIAATQNCPWRKRILQGEVDDEHSWLLNGVAGHAGLFGTIQGVLELCVHILNQWKAREKSPLYSNALIQKALARKYTDRTWCLGFDTPSSSGSSGGSYISPNSVGHLGFTGTSFWIDPEKDVVVVLLTNRIHPDRNNDKIKQFRPLLHDTVFKALLA